MNPEEEGHRDPSTVKPKGKVLPPSQDKQNELHLLCQILFMEGNIDKIIPEIAKAGVATQRRVQMVQGTHISQIHPPNTEEEDITPQTPSFFEDFIPHSVGEITKVIVDTVARTSLRTFE